MKESTTIREAFRLYRQDMALFRVMKRAARLDAIARIFRAMSRKTLDKGRAICYDN